MTVNVHDYLNNNEINFIKLSFFRIEIVNVHVICLIGFCFVESVRANEAQKYPF